MEECEFCHGTGKSRYFDMVVCEKTCGTEKTCSKGFDCEIAAGTDLCPECYGTGEVHKRKLMQLN